MTKEPLTKRPIKEYILTGIPTAHKGDTVKKILGVLAKESNKYDTVDNIYVIDDLMKLIGVVSLRTLYNSKLTDKIEKLMIKKVITASPESEAERIADLAIRHDLKAVPVVDEEGKLIGAVTSRRVFSIVNKALKEDIFHFAGIHRSHTEFKNSLEVPVKSALKARLPWLLMGLFGSILIALFIDYFEVTLSRNIVIAAFIPALVYMSGALSSQVLMIFIREMTVEGKSFNFKAYFAKEMWVSFLLAISIVIVMLGTIMIFWGETYLALVISLATFISIIITVLIAIMIAVAIKRFKFDPALGSGPIATVISDLTSVIIYFLIVAWLV